MSHFRIALVSVCFLVIGFSRPAHAIGEIERVFSLTMNYYANGVLLADIEAEKARLKGEFIRKKAEFDLAVERGRGEASVRILRAEVSFVERRKQEFVDLQAASRSLVPGLQVSIDLVHEFRGRLSSGLLGVDALAASARIELGLQDDGARHESLAALAQTCADWMHAGVRTSRICQAVILVASSDAKAAELITTLSEIELQTTSRGLIRAKAKLTSHLQSLEFEIQGVDQLLGALKKRLEKLGGGS